MAKGTGDRLRSLGRVATLEERRELRLEETVQELLLARGFKVTRGYQDLKRPIANLVAKGRFLGRPLQWDVR